MLTGEKRALDIVGLQGTERSHSCTRVPTRHPASGGAHLRHHVARRVGLFRVGDDAGVTSTRVNP